MHHVYYYRQDLTSLLYGTEQFTNLNNIATSAAGGGISAQGSGEISFPVKLGDDYTGLTYADGQIGCRGYFRVFIIVQGQGGSLIANDFNYGGEWDVGEVYIGHKSLPLSQAMKNMSILSMAGETATINTKSGSLVADMPIKGSDSILIWDNPAFLDWQA